MMVYHICLGMNIGLSLFLCFSYSGLSTHLVIACLTIQLYFNGYEMQVFAVLSDGVDIPV